MKAPISSRQEELPTVVGDTTPVENQYLSVPEEDLIPSFNPHNSSHEMELPFRMCIVAPSGTGKTSFLVSLIKKFNPPGGEFQIFYDIYIISPNTTEPLFINLKRLLGDRIFICNGLKEIPTIDGFDNKYQHLLCFDDFLNENQKKIIDYYARGRNRNCSVVFYVKTIMGLIRIFVET